MQQVRFAGVDSSQQKRGVARPVMSLIAVVVAVMMVGALLATPSYNSLLVSTGELATKTRELVDGSAVSSQEQALRDQLAAVGEGLTLDAASSTIDARFLLAGPAFTQGDTPFSIATSSYQGAAVEAVAPVADGDRILYERGDVTEWWQMAGSSYQQGWTIAAPPTDGTTDLSLIVGFGNATPVAESDTSVRLTLADGTPVWYRELIAFDANGTDLPATMTVEGSNVRIDVDASGAVYPVTVDPLVGSLQEVLAPATATGDLFGEAIATDADRVAVSAREADNPAGNSFGRVDVFEWDGDGQSWFELDSVYYPGGGGADFGWSIDINGDFLVVGAPEDDTNGANAGAVFLYEYDDTDGEYDLIQSLYECAPGVGSCDGTATGAFAGGEFGYDVSVDSNGRVAVGAPISSAFVSAGGAAYVYTEIGVTGVLELTADGILTTATLAPALASGDRFGEAIDMTDDGAFIIAGLPGRDVGGAADSGTVLKYEESAPTWNEDGSDNGPSFQAGAEYGASVAINEDSLGLPIAVAGRPFRTRRNPTDPAATLGTIRVLNASSGNLTTVGLGSISAFTANDGFGYDVAFDDDVVMTGGPFNSPGGVVYAYEYLPGSVSMDGGGGASAVTLPNASDTFNQPGDMYGSAVAVSTAENPYFLIGGSPGHDATQNGRFAESAGRIGVYEPTLPTTYLRSAELTATTADRVGYSIAVSGDQMAVGSVTDDATLGGSGAVLFYDRVSSSDPWEYDSVVTYPAGASETAGLYGESLDMEGNFLAVGTSTGQFGRVDVYEFTGGNWTLRDSIEGPAGFNTANSLQFGSDVAISTDGDVLVVGINGYDYAGCDDCGAAQVYDWDIGGTEYVARTLIDDGQFAAFENSGMSLDMDEIPGSADMRLVVGNTEDQLPVYIITDGLGAPVSTGDNLDVPSGAAESVAIDGNRIAVAGLSGGSDSLTVIDINASGEYVNRELFSGDLFTGTGALPNNQVDVSGDTIVVGRSDGLGGEVGVFYNDPTYGWGLADVTEAWIDGPVERIQPAGRAVQDSIGRAVAIDDAGANKTIVFGAPGVDDNGEEAGAFYAQQYAEDQTPAPANKLVSPDFKTPGELGSAISVGESAWGIGGVVAAENGRQVHRIEKVSDVSWEIVQTFDYFSDVIDVDFQESDGKMAVLLGNGNVIFYQEDACGVAPDCSFTATGISGDDANLTAGSVAISGDDVLVAVASSFSPGDLFLQYFWADGSNGPVGPPAGVVLGDEFGTDMEASGDFVFVGAPGASADAGKVHVWDNGASSWILEIDAPDGGRFGHGVSADGTTVAIGAPTHNEGGGAFDGQTYVYEFVAPPTPSLTLVDTLDPSGGSGLSGWGWSIAVDGGSLVIGATGYEQSGIPYRHGTATAFGFDGANWVETDKFTASDFASADQAGFAVDIVGKDVLVGANFDDNPQGENAGAVYAYTATDAVPAISNKIITADTSEEFGREIAISGTTAVVAEPRGDRVHILEQSGGVWSITQTFNEPNVVDVDIDDAAGRMVVVKDDRDVVYYERVLGAYTSVGGTTLGVGGTPSTVLLNGNDVFVGRQNSVTGPLVRLGWLDATLGQEFAPAGIVAGEETGRSLAIDGNLLFVGAPRWDNLPDDEAGRVYIFDTGANAFTGGTIEADGDGILFGFDLAAQAGRLVVGYPGGDGFEAGLPARVGLVETYTSLTTTGATFEQLLSSDDQVISDFFGSKVDIDGDVIVVGANAKALPVVSRAGQVYVFRLDGGTWTEAETFTASDGATDDQLGNDVVIEGSSVLAGAWKDDNQRGVDAGAVYSFELAPAPPSLPNKVTIADIAETGDDRFGLSVDIDGDWAVVGEPGQDGGPNQGRVHVLENIGGVWTIQQTLTRSAAIPTFSDRFGWTVAIDGDRFVVGSKNDGFVTLFTRPDSASPFAEADTEQPTTGGIDSVAIQGDIVGASSVVEGEVYFYRDSGISGLLAQWTASNPAFQPADEFGATLAFGGTPESAGGCGVALVGAPSYDSTGGDFGRVYVYPNICLDGGAGTSPSQTVEPTISGENFGSALAADGDRVVIGQQGGIGVVFGGPAQGATGLAHYYEYDDGDLEISLVQTLESADFADHSAVNDKYGSSVDISGDVIVVGALDATELAGVARTGAAYPWALEGGVWTEKDPFRAADGATDDRFGRDVAISGLRVLVGAPDDDNTAGTDAGAVYSFIASAPQDNPTLFFDLGLFPGDPTSVAVAPTGIAVSDFDAEVLDDASDDGTSIAAASLGETDVVDSPLSGIELGSTPLSGILLDENSSLSSIPVIEVDIDGGWAALFDATGSALADVPLVDVTLGDVAEDPQASGQLFSTPLSGIEVDGTPLSGIPLSGILLGDLPLSGISTDVPWCTILAPFLGGTCDPNTTTLLDATLSGIPLSGIPLSGIPLSGIDLSGTPLSGIQVGELELQNSPLSGIPLSGIDVGSTPLSGIPLSGIPLLSLPLSGIEIEGTPLSGIGVDGTPLSGIPLSGIAVDDSPLSGIPLSGIELRNVPLSGIPLSGIDVGSLPLADLPLSGIALADVPLSGIPLSGIGTDWCTLLSEFASEYDCSFRSPTETEADFLDNTTIAELGLRGVPIGELPLSGIPLSGITIGTLPLSGIDLEGIPLSGIPLSGIPLSGIDPTGTPLSGIPLSGITLDTLPLSGIDVQGSPLSGIPLSGIDLANLPLSGIDLEASPLSGIPLSGIPVIGTPLSGILVGGTPLSGIPLSGIDVVGSPLSGIPLSGIDVAGAPLSGIGVDCSLVDCDIDTLGDAIIAGAIDPTTVTLSQIQPWLGGLRLGDIADSLNDSTREDLENALAASGLLIGSLTDLDDLTLGDLPASLLSNVLLGDLNDSLWSVTYEDLVGAIIDPLTGEPFANSTLVADVFETYLSGFTFGDFDYFGNATFGDLLNSVNTGDFTFADLGPILGLLHLTDLVDLTDFAAQGGTLGTVTEEQLGDLTLLDLFGENFASFDTWTVADLLAQADLVGALYGYEIADLFLMLVGLDPAAFDGLDFTEVETGNLPESLIDAVTFVAEFEVRDTLNNKTVDVSAQLPGTASYVPGSTIIEDENLNVFTSEPTIDGNTLTWTVNGAIPDSIVFIQFDVKPTVTIGSTSIAATGNIQGTDAGGFATAAIAVTEGTEPNDFPATTAANEDTVYLTYISSETDNDVFSITIGENDELAIQLSSLTADLDIALYGDPADDSVASALTAESELAPLEPITDPDQTGADTEPLDDFRRLDEEDPNLRFIDLSNAPGTETELLVTDALPAGTYYVQVFGANGATNVEPAALQIAVVDADDRPVCSANGQITDGTIGTFPVLTGSTANTLFLVNEQRMTSLYPGEWADLDTEIDDLVAYLNANPQLGIDPVVVSVDGDATVRAAYDAWDTDAACSPESANAVVQAIIEQAIDPLRGTLEHIVVIGGDQIIPMARLLDVTEIANEYDYRYEFIGDNALGDANNINALSASFWDRQYLSDEPYGESSARSLGNRFLYVSDIALGRMVETPDEIEAALQHFQTFNGQLDANTAAVLGYDFLVDSSEEIAADLAAAGLTVDDDLADGFDGPDKWDKDDAEDKVIPPGGAPDLISLNAHFDHYRALPADGDKVPNFTNNFLADTVANAVPGLLDGSIVFSMGCHGGLSVSDLQILDGTVNNNGDWAQTFAADQAIFIGNTGFGYGDTEAVAYTEKLMALFAEKAVRPTQVPGQMGTTTIGQALTFAKNEYASDLSVFSVYDEKALMESTFYGLPFYRVDVTPVPADPVPTNVTAPDSTGNESITVTATPTNDLDATPLGDIYSNPDENGDPQTIVAPGMPIQPSQSFDVSVVDPADSTQLGAVARGALVLDMDSTYVDPTDPVVSTAIFNESVNLPEPELGEVVFPAKPVTINTATTPGGDRQTLVVATGQFESSDNVFGSQRLDENIDVVVYYADATDPDFTAPTIGAVESTLESTPAGAELTVTLSTVDDAGSVTRVYLLVAANPGVGPVDWVGLDLVKDGASDDWSGSTLLPTGTTDVEFLVQAVDSSGNVGFATNKARNFNEDDTPEPEPPTPGLEVTVDPTNLDAPSGWYTGDVDITVNSSGLTATYLVQPGGTTMTVPVGGVFTVTRDGVNTVTVTRADGQKITRKIRIDTVDPSVSIAPPANGAIFLESSVPNVGFVCQDPSLISCTATADGNPIEPADPLPATVGPHTVSVTAVDALGNSITETVGYVVDPDTPVGDPPVILDAEIDGVALPGEPVDIYGEFEDGVGPYTVEIDWGNGDVCPGVGGCSIEAPGAGEPGIFEASYTYPVGGAFDVEITITDSTGASVSTTLTTATCTIVGTNNNDFIQGTSGPDVICGLGGNDWINARGGADIVFGGRGNDTIRGANGPDVLYGGRGGDILLGQAGNDTLIGGQGWDILSGGWGADVAKGRGGDDVLLGSSGRDILIGNKGHDEIYGGGGQDDLQGGRGDDFISGSFGDDLIAGGSGHDTIYGGGADDTIIGGAGEDWVSGGPGADDIDGGDDDDDLRGDWGNDVIEGGDGTDRCRGGAGNDQLTGCEL